MRVARVLATPPPKQNPIAPSLPVQSGRAFSQGAAATKSSVIFGAIQLGEQRPAFSSSPGYPPTEVSASGANAMKFAVPRRRATSSTYGLRPRFS